MIRPQLTVDGTAVRLPLAGLVASLLDDLALAYSQDPKVLGQMLAAHAGRVLAADIAQCSEDATDYGRAVAAAEADGTREALLDELPAEHQFDPQYSPDEAITLAGRITRHAAHIRHTTNRSTRP